MPSANIDGFISFINSQRHSLHICMAFETKERKEYNSPILSDILDYRKKIETELTNNIQDIINILDSTLIKNSEENIGKIYYLKLKGDFNRYICEYEKSHSAFSSIIYKNKLESEMKYGKATAANFIKILLFKIKKKIVTRKGVNQ